MIVTSNSTCSGFFCDSQQQSELQTLTAGSSYLLQVYRIGWDKVCRVALAITSPSAIARSATILTPTNCAGLA